VLGLPGALGILPPPLYNYLSNANTTTRHLILRDCESQIKECTRNEAKLKTLNGQEWQTDIFIRLRDAIVSYVSVYSRLCTSILILN